MLRWGLSTANITHTCLHGQIFWWCTVDSRGEYSVCAHLLGHMTVEASYIWLMRPRLKNEALPVLSFLHSILFI